MSLFLHVAEPELSERMAYSRMSPNVSRGLKAERERNHQFTALSYTLPDGSNERSHGTMGTRSPTYTDEKRETGDHGRLLLMFHGVILRSQLIELIKNKVFFNEGSRVND